MAILLFKGYISKGLFINHVTNSYDIKKVPVLE